ncbi:MAG: acetate kinase, partial [Candidatus Saccharimonas sp.]
AVLRKRIIAHLECFDFILDGEANEACTAPEKMTFISQKAASKPIVVIPTDEAKEIAKHALAVTV